MYVGRQCGHALIRQDTEKQDNKWGEIDSDPEGFSTLFSTIENSKTIARLEDLLKSLNANIQKQQKELETVGGNANPSW